MMVTWLPITNQGYMVGDYISTSIGNDGKAHSVFAVAHAPTGSVFDEAMYSPTNSLPLDTLGLRVKAGGGEVPVPGAASDHPPLKMLPTAHRCVDDGRQTTYDQVRCLPFDVDTARLGMGL